MLPPSVLIVGSQNVLTNTSGRVAVRKGYTLDGQIDATIAPILGAFDWERHTGDTRNLRSGNALLQNRYVATAGDRYNGLTFTAGQVYWITVLGGLSSVELNFADFWDTTAFQSRLLFVNGESNIKEWTGVVTTLAARTANTITKTGTTTWAEEGAYTAGTRSVIINGTTYTYTGGEASTTLTGVSPSPAAEPLQSVIIQSVRVTANSATTGLLATLENSLIANLRNQIYIGSLVNNSVYISRQDNYLSFSFTTPVRLVGEGALVTLDGPPVAFRPQEDHMYISAGKDQWYETKFTLSSDLSAESFEIIRLKTAPKQAAKSQAFVTNDKNDVVFVSNEPVLTTLGRVSGVIATPQSGDISFPIINDFNAYDFDDGSCKYFRNFLYVAVPQEGLIRIYNQTDKENHYWEAPQVIPVSRFSIIDGELYGHSYQTPQTFKLFDGYNDNGAPILAQATFSYNNYGTRSQRKNFNEFFIEGYMSANTKLELELTYDINGCATVRNYDIDGSSRQIVCLPPQGVSLGKDSLGKNPLGSSLRTSTADSLPPKLRGIKTVTRIPFYEEQTTFRSLGMDQQWEILAFGPLVQLASEGNNHIKF